MAKVHHDFHEKKRKSKYQILAYEHSCIINLRPNNLIFLHLVNLVKVKDHLSNSKSRTVNALSSNKRVLDKAPRKVKEQLLFLKEFYDVHS